MTPQDINLSAGILQRWQQAQDFVNTSVDSLTNSAQQIGDSLTETATGVSHRAIDTATITIAQTQEYLTQGLQIAEQIKDTTSAALQTAITSPLNDWLAQHPLFLRLFQIIGWATNHPIISFVILLFIIALFWSIIKAIMRLIETASWSIIQVPLKLFQALIKVGFVSLRRLVNLAIAKITGNQISNFKSKNTRFFIPENSAPLCQDKQQRLAEISSRLAAIQQEQNQLLQEAADLIALDKIDCKIKQKIFE